MEAGRSGALTPARHCTIFAYMDADFWRTHLDRCPALRPWLERAARVAVRREAMPATLTLGPVPQDRAVRQALEALFGGYREERGRLAVRLEGPLQERTRWLPLAAMLGIAEPSDCAEDGLARRKAALNRLKLLFPGERTLLGLLRDSEAVRRFCAVSEESERELTDLFGVLAFLREPPGGITLSELGARCLNDSKALRSGRLRQMLELLLRLRLDAQDCPDRDALAEAGVIDNPYTTHVVVCAPFSYRVAESGEWDDAPHRLWRRGEAAILSWQAVQGLEAVRFEAPCGTLVTSENAAPFLRLVQRRTPCLYTAGYPNSAVKGLLRRFAENGAAALHWGDTDLDGYRIAEQVAACIPTRFLEDSPEAARACPRPLDVAQRRRAERFLAAHPEFRYAGEVRRTLEEGWREQELALRMPARRKARGAELVLVYPASAPEPDPGDSVR